MLNKFFSNTLLQNGDLTFLGRRTEIRDDPGDEEPQEYESSISCSVNGVKLSAFTEVVCYFCTGIWGRKVQTVKQ